jgi:hypothetical protein
MTAENKPTWSQDRWLVEVEVVHRARTCPPARKLEISRNFQISQIRGGKFPGNFLEIFINFSSEISGPKTSKHYCAALLVHLVNFMLLACLAGKNFNKKICHLEDSTQNYSLIYRLSTTPQTQLLAINLLVHVITFRFSHWGTLSELYSRCSDCIGAHNAMRHS